MQSSENFEFSENLERSKNSENLELSENLEYSENLELSDNFEYSLYSDNGGSHNKTLWNGNYVKPWAVTIPHNPNLTIQNPPIFPSIPSYPPLSLLYPHNPLYFYGILHISTYSSITD